jgi:hypothetical protein
MHHAVFVVGDDFAEQMNRLMAENEDGSSWCDWWGIGGRFTGGLPLLPGATGKTFGYAAPPFERMLAEYISGQGYEVHLGTCDQTDDGVDQARIGDIDLSALCLPSAVVMGGEVVLEKYSPLEQAQAVLKHLEALPADTLLTVLDVHG